ncbi:UNVERIFIED_CONTAM: hypothetical protein FKN15_013913 [Acipenser sinensis]
MPVRQDAQLEKLIDETLKKSEFQSLEEFLQGDINEDACQKCTKQFINKLDKVIRRVVYENSSEGKKQVIGSFLHRTGELIADSSVHITIQQEAVRKLNMILDEIPKEDKTQILSSGKVLYYDLQVAITEALCRMTTGKQRQELADQWFTMEFVANAFKGIKDSEFETLLMPADDKLQDFWIDFNVGSQSITFYISPDDDEEETQWETVCLPEDEVEKYLVEEKDGNNLLKVSMKHPLNVSGKEGSQIQIYFSAALNIAEAIKNVYGAIKAKEFVGKCGSSVAKTTVRIIFDEDGSQLDTPAKMRVSEATLAISSCGGSRTAMSPIARVMTTSTPARKGKVKPALELVGSSKRNSDYNLIKLKSETPIRKSPGCIPAEREYGTSANNKQIPAAKVAEMLQEDQDNARASEEEHLGTKYFKIQIGLNRVSKQQAFSAAFNDQSPPQLQRSKEPSQKQVQEQLAEKLEKPNKEKKRKHEADGKRSSGETSALEENQAVVRGIKGQGQAPLAVQKAENSAVQCSKSNKKPALGSSRKETIPQEMSPARNHRDSVSHRQENLQRGREREMEVSYREMKEKANDTRRLEKSGKSDKSGKSEDSRIKSGSLEKGECKKKVGGNENAQKDKAVPTRQTGRPQRAAAKGRRYWEPSESGSDVESVASSQEEEQSVYKPKQHPAKTNQERNKKVSAPPEQKKSAGALPQVTMRKELQKTWISQFSPLTSPPPSIEKMRYQEVQSTISSHMVSTVDMSSWETSGNQDMGMMCQKFSTDLKRKFQNRSRKMEYYTKQSLQSVQQHLSSVSVQVRECRVQKLESFMGEIMDELNDFEKDTSTLKNMEKELTNFWKKQTQELTSYQEKEQRRCNVSGWHSEKHSCHILSKAVTCCLFLKIQGEDGFQKGVLNIFNTVAVSAMGHVYTISVEAAVL